MIYPGNRVKQVAFQQHWGDDYSWWQDPVYGTVIEVQNIGLSNTFQAYIEWDNHYGDGWYNEATLNVLRDGEEDPR